MLLNIVRFSLYSKELGETEHQQSIFRFQISSLRSRLEKSDKELERASVGRVEAER